MRLSKLRGAIRSSKGNPSVTVELTQGDPITLMLHKTPLLAELGRVYADADDTGLSFDPETGVLSAIDNSYAAEAAASGAFDDDAPELDGIDYIAEADGGDPIDDDLL